MGCHAGCRARFKDGTGDESSCITTSFYWDAKSLDVQRAASDLISRYGLNAAEIAWGLFYISALADQGLLWADGTPEFPLDFKDYGSQDFVGQFVRMVAYGGDGKGNESRFGRDISAESIVAQVTRFLLEE